ncbi:DUF2461 domain-containing protein [Flavobacteriaceae bacterium TP-CH-4]|uniref:DUF2461 domain-containing protein n=1 Tax=Pelagihabitans pacificus TaxID=2696054 RepID=A0A967E6X5_9FLAO|nr:DUF2461 domain-containing protein [Pelagihabitans pacificus]NHF60992.1 DUF2461 domain-containing protein [Pelagihabitans pacificus]
MSFYKMYDFLRDLEKNNSKAWMDEHRTRYEEIRYWFIDWLDALDDKLSEEDAAYHPTPGKKAISRINNNLLYHPEKPTYKNHFGANLDKAPGKAAFVIHLGTDTSFIGGGFYHPKREVLKQLRKGIDTRGDRLKKIMEQKSFRDTFGTLVDVSPLKTAPQGYSKEHQHIDLLNHTSFVVTYRLTQKEVLSDDFKNSIISLYHEMKPFRKFLNDVVADC